MLKQVVLAPVPLVHLESAWTKPELRERVAFGSSSPNVATFPIGIPVFILGSGLSLLRERYPPSAATWGGTLGAVEQAVEGGQRSGMHRDPSRRPPTAERIDIPFRYFYEVLNLQRLGGPRHLSEFTKIGGIKRKPFTGPAPQWPVLAELEC
jgi:hypothetical protein